MSDQDKKDPEAKKAEDKPHVAKPGQDDSDEIVTGAAGEKMSGIIADIADGDR
ncbi:MAG TPA: hypothetical protein VFE03_15265 [Caulobacteraceae bacterium]|nr:hypothetical protein [Caulobacteraceae bacterium]